MPAAETFSRFSHWEEPQPHFSASIWPCVCPTSGIENRPRRLLKPEVRRPGSDDWEDISWDQALDEIAHRIKKTRDDTFVEKNAQGRTANRCEGFAWIGGCTDTNEFNYLIVKTMRSLGVTYIENQAPV
jgi:formate dehydrogenase major subunit